MSTIYMLTAPNGHMVPVVFKGPKDAQEWLDSNNVPKGKYKGSHIDHPTKTFEELKAISLEILGVKP